MLYCFIIYKMMVENSFLFVLFVFTFIIVCFVTAVCIKWFILLLILLCKALVKPITPEFCFIIASTM